MSRPHHTPTTSTSLPLPSLSNSSPLPPPPLQPTRSYLRCEPESKQISSRTLILCFDGTGNAFGQNVTNLPTLFGLLSEDPQKQLSYYQTGIGTAIATQASPWAPTKILEKIGQAIDAGVAWSLGSHIMKGYEWLMNQYLPGDKIFIFGFSRGAFTARALAGMLQQVGLLPAGNSESIPLAYSIYKKSETQLTPSETLSQGFKRTFSREVRVHFVGVWDTVSSVGAIWPRTLPFAAGSNYIRHFRQALALDECRARYAEQVWVDEDNDHPWCGKDDEHAPTTIQEVWFAGAHSNIGGGEFPYDGYITPALSNLSFRWMVREAVEQGLELDSAHVASSPIFSPFYQQAIDACRTRDDTELIKYLKLAKDANPDANEHVVACVYLSTKPSATSTMDALAPRANHVAFSIEKRPKEVRKRMKVGARVAEWWGRVRQRAITLGWWCLEVSPTLKVVWDAEGKRRSWNFHANLGRGRLLPPSPSFHFSVKERLEAHDADEFGPGNNENFPEGQHYHFAARFRRGHGMEGVKWVD
ncbi:hypothetical protein JCM8547_006791 [Rhodosporidiobolus lusitaniae]